VLAVVVPAVPVVIAAVPSNTTSDFSSPVLPSWIAHEA